MLRTAKTENGIVRGMAAANNRITVYKGIPFAAPPVGDNRWKAPKPCENWEGEYEAYTFKNIAMQDTPGYGDNIYVREWSDDREVPIGEDCLYLNIWTPVRSLDEKLPVLVFFHGGAFQWGFSYEMEFDGENLAKRGIILVQIPYRMGVFGFLAHDELCAEDPLHPTNFGLLDQQAGIRWVKRNIAAFGGDPEKITIAGQSAGGGSVLNQLICEDNKDLFCGAIIMSGIIRDPFYVDHIITPMSIDKVKANGADFLEYLGVDSIAKARELDAFLIREKYAKFAEEHPRFVPCIDGVFVKDDPITLMLNDRYNKVPIMAGNTEDEFKIRIPKQERKYAGTAEEVSGIESAVKAVFTGKDNCYYYRFASDIPGEDNPGTFHSVDLWFFFETLNKCWRPMVGRHYDLARKMANYWAYFVKTGNPNGPDCDNTPMPEWKIYDGEGNLNEMVFTSEGPVPTVEDDSLTQHLKNLIIEKYK